MGNLKRDNLDLDMKQMLKAYAKNTPRRKPESRKYTREKFIEELKKMFSDARITTAHSTSRPSQSISSIWISGLNQLKENFAMKSAQRSVRTVLLSVIMMAVFFFGGSGIITAYAAKAALPGDALYQIKTSLEDTRANLTGDQASQARLYLDFAGSRLSEIEALINDGRSALIADTANQFKKEVHKALDAIENLAKTDPDQAAVLRAEAADILKTYSDTLSTILAAAPVEIQPLLIDAIAAAQTDDLANNENSNDNSNTNDNSNSNANVSEDNGNGSDDDSNINSNTNGNGSLFGDDNSHGSSNTNGNISDDNGNFDNSNGNISDDDDENGNSNSSDDISNNNGDDDNTGSSSSNSNSTVGDDNSHSGSNTNGSDDSGSGGGSNRGGSDDNSNSGGSDDKGSNSGDNGNSNSNTNG